MIIFPISITILDQLSYMRKCFQDAGELKPKYSSNSHEVAKQRN